MKKILTAIFAMMLVFSGCSPIQDGLGGMSAVLGVDLSSAQIKKQLDDHGGFHGDGSSYWELSFSAEEGAALEKSIQQTEGWRALPVSEEGEILLYGSDGVGPYLKWKEQGMFPKVETGYWFFYDRQTKSYETTDVASRGAYNFTAALYDSQTYTLYYGELDT